MDYSVGSRIRVRLYSGKVVESEMTAIANQSTGRKLQIVYGNVTASTTSRTLAWTRLFGQN